MTIDQEQLAAQVLAGYKPIDDNMVSTPFGEYVMEQIAARPSPAPPAESIESRLSRVEGTLDEILALLRGGTPE